MQRFTLNKAITPPFFPYQGCDDAVDIIPVRDADDDQLLAISKERRLALDLAEMQAVQAHYQQEKARTDRRGTGNDRPNLERTLCAQNVPRKN
ncbi:MAG: hypothetical protein M5U34_21100 [Chloroflexi bacterium]|nr:hypothetical protein [Chloroflexota bacterium]